MSTDVLPQPQSPSQVIYKTARGGKTAFVEYEVVAQAPKINHYDALVQRTTRQKQAQVPMDRSALRYPKVLTMSIRYALLQTGEFYFQSKTPLIW